MRATACAAMLLACAVARPACSAAAIADAPLSHIRALAACAEKALAAGLQRSPTFKRCTWVRGSAVTHGAAHLCSTGLT